MVRLVILTTVLTALTACGGNDSERPASDLVPPEGVFGTAPPASRGIPSVVTLVPLDEVDGAAGARRTQVMDQASLTFAPQELLVPLGDTVLFLNSEAALTHNVTIISMTDRAELFNDDAYAGEELKMVFSAEGGYAVLCDVHPGMTAFVYATGAPYSAFAAANGDFRLSDVPPGAYSLHVWSAEPDQRSQLDISVQAGATEVFFPQSR